MFDKTKKILELERDMFDKTKKILELERDNNSKDKTIEELAAKLAEKDKTIETLNGQLKSMTGEINTIKTALSSVPGDCKPGDYCRACEFGKDYSVRVYNPWGQDHRQHIMLCNKAGACGHFVQKDESRL